jgi:hypothetical protein
VIIAGPNLFTLLHVYSLDMVINTFYVVPFANLTTDLFCFQVYLSRDRQEN